MSAARRPEKRGRHDHEGPELRGDRRSEERPADAVAARSNAASAATMSSAGQTSYRDRISEPTRSGVERGIQGGLAPDEREHAHGGDAARGDDPFERARVVVEERRHDEHRQRTGRVLDGEVAIRDPMVIDDRRAVALVGRPVDDVAVRPEPRVDETEAREEQSPATSASRHRCIRLLTRGSRDAVRRARARRTGRTTAGRDRTSASGRAQTRSAPRR